MKENKESTEISEIKLTGTLSGYFAMMFLDSFNRSSNPTKPKPTDQNRHGSTHISIRGKNLKDKKKKKEINRTNQRKTDP